MAFSPGKNVGRVSIRVVPDTTKFRVELRRKLEQIERTTTMTVRVDSAKVDNAKVRESLRRQLAEFKNLDFAANVEVVVDKAKIRRGKLRASIQEQFDKMTNVSVWIAPKIHKRDEETFYFQVDRMIRKASGKAVDVGVNAHTAAASAQMRYVTRPRFVDIFVRVNKASVAKALATFAALSGARLSWQWIDDLYQKVRNLDKTLPTILNWTSGITALIAALMGGVSGLVGIGQGLFSITPALLVLPGLFLNALGSITALIVALRNSGTELAVLKDDMHAIGDVINDEFWGRARQPIIDLVQGLMPQLLNSFRNLSAGIGDFTAALAQAFGQELAGGRLESIFAGIAEGWRILGTGAAGFAGALVNLSEIAAKYTPRLARWFVRQADTFDNFLTSIATDGRLESWMEGAIDSMYDLWDATRGFAGVLSGIWKAADQAGSNGLKGFGQMMLEWRDIVNSTYFQRGLSAIFRGSYVAMDAFGEAIKSLGRLIGDMPVQFERFVGSVGGFLGGIFDAAFQALNNTNVKIGLDGFSQGLDAALAGIKPALDPIAQTFGDFLGLLGDLAANILPTAAGVLADLMPAIQGIIDAVGGVLPGLGDAVSSFSETVGPAITDLVEALSPAFVGVMEGLGNALERIGPSLRDLVKTVGPELADAIVAITPILDAIDLNMLTSSLQLTFDPEILVNPEKLQSWVEGVKGRGGWLASLYTFADELGFIIGQGIVKIRDWIMALPETIGNFITQTVPQIIPAMIDLAVQVFEGFLQGLEVGIINAGNWFLALPGRITTFVATASTWLSQTGVSVIDGLIAGLNLAVTNVAIWFALLPPRIMGALGDTSRWLWQAGRGIMDGLLGGMKAAFEAVKSFVTGIATWIVNNKGPISYDRRLLVPAGRAMMSGLNEGLRTGFTDVQRNVRSMAFDVSAGFDGASLSGAGQTNHITMPLLPGETPAEQRDNLVRELSLIH